MLILKTSSLLDSQRMLNDIQPHYCKCDPSNELA